MNNKQNDLDIVGDFLIRFYHEEPYETRAAINAMRAIRGLSDYEWTIAEAFRSIFNTTFAPHTLENFVKHKANRYVKSDTEARSFLIRVYQDTSLDGAINLNELTD